MSILFIDFSRLEKHLNRSGEWLISKWRFILPDVLFYFHLKSKGVKLDEPLEKLFDYDSLLLEIREIELVKCSLEKDSVQVTNKSMLVKWLESKGRSPRFDTILRFVWRLEKYNSLWAKHQAIENYLTKEELLNHGN